MCILEKIEEGRVSTSFFAVVNNYISLLVKPLHLLQIVIVHREEP